MNSLVSNRLSLAVVVTATALWSEPLSPDLHAACLEITEQKVSEVAEPPPFPVPNNASVITATVRKYTIWPPGSLKGTVPILPPDQTHYSLTVEIHTSQPQSFNLESIARPGMIIETFSSAEFSTELVGKTIEATLQLTGGTHSVRWQISKVRALQ